MSETEALPEPMVRVLGEYERHLAVERDLTARTAGLGTAEMGSELERLEQLGLVEQDRARWRLAALAHE